MAVTARFNAPIQVITTQEVRDRIEAIADRDEVSMASVIRDVIDAGLPARELESQPVG